ncbi:TonB-dependent siderophore receptor [Herbaspirillum rubrisubalbicans]|uniref:TonB-dependent siderophore receptor n=1 Tax=Herbaspirillum rubrisubalbicans TaxID=80842 RepID=UPI00155850CA|nr:TonB-dependent siderophore receptor [Herbaspirillum rubrisubalbicans]NQE48956.1 ligand-gated channel protein [Herbaspirillum rubrisubalbicans]
MTTQQAFPTTACWLAASLITAAPLAWAQTPAQDSGSATALPEVSVSASKDKSNYLAPSTSGATRTDTPLMEIPQAVRVMTTQQIEDLGAVRLADTVDYVSGISRLNDFGGTWDNFAIRGFSSTDMGFLVNGFPGSRGYNPRRDTATIERIEFLKGPAAALYGSSEPGGTINIVTKKPQFTRNNSAELSAGSGGLKRATVDSTGPLGQNLAYRLIAMTEEGDSRSSLLSNRRSLVAPSLAWVIDKDTLLNYEAEFLQASTPLDRGLINVRGVLGGLPRDRVLNEPSDGNMAMRSNTHQLTLERTLSEQWRAKLGASYKESSFDGFYTEAALSNPLAADNRTLRRTRTWRQLPSRDTSVQAELQGDFSTGAIGHTLLLGAESSTLWMNTEILRSAPLASIDIYNPVYGSSPLLPLTNRTSSSDEHQRVKAVFVQDQLSLSSQWKLLAGLRWDQYNQSIQNRVGGVTNTSQQQSAVSPRAGISYLPNAWSSLYLSAGKSFRPNSGVDVNGRAFDPQHSTAYEAGLKLQTSDERLGANFALYDITKTNVLTASDVPGFMVAAGEAKSTGFEADAYGQLDAHWRISANFSWDNARVTKDKTLAAGTRLTNIPAYSAGLLAIREDATASGARYGLGGGINYVGNRSGNTADTYSLPAYATVKLLSYWQVSKHVRLSLDVNNLFNRNYYPGSWNNLYVMPGAERTVVARMKIDL